METERGNRKVRGCTAPTGAGWIVRGWLALIALVPTLSGCHSLQCPRIDPTGQCLFLPHQFTTGLSDHFGHGSVLPSGSTNSHACGLKPSSAFQMPVDPPPCVDGSAPPEAKPVGTGMHADRGDTGQLLVTPTTIVAPVGGEVVILAAICGKDGFFVTKEPIEWMLSPDSVGTFLEVGDEWKGKPLHQWNASTRVEKVDVDFARGRTSSLASRITRGSPKSTDDLFLKKGQTWLSVTSPSEGVSRITVLAPDSKIWDQRRQTVMIYWIDAQWRFPDPITVENSSTARIVTQVFQSEGFIGAEGWKVIYRSLNPEVARFLPSGSERAEVLVDKDGNATVEIQNVANRIGSAVIAIEVVRPAQASTKMKELILGRGQTVVSWSAPQLVLNAGGTEAATPGQKFTLGASLANAGDLAAENVVLRAELPVGMQLLGTTPKATQVTDRTAVWEIGTLPARQQLDVALELVGTVEADATVQFSATGSSKAVSAEPSMRVSKSLPIRLAKPSLQISLSSDIGERVEVGQPIPYSIAVVNTGKQSVSDLQLLVETDTGLVEASTERNSVEQRLGSLAAGERVVVPIRLVARKEGVLGIRATANSTSTSLASAQSSVTAAASVPAQAALSVRLMADGGLTQMNLGTTKIVRTEVVNRGTAPLIGVQVQFQYPNGVQAVQASNGTVTPRREGVLQWNLPGPLQPGSMVQLDTQLLGVLPGSVPLVATAQSADGIQGSDRMELQVLGQMPANPTGPGSGAGPVLPPVEPSGQPSAEPTGPWALEIRPSADPIPTDRVSTFDLFLRNLRAVDDQDVIVSVAVPQGVRIESLEHIDRLYQTTFESIGIVSTETIRTVRAGEVLQWKLRITPQLEQPIILRARVISRQNPSPVDTSTQVQVVRP